MKIRLGTRDARRNIKLSRMYLQMRAPNLVYAIARRGCTGSALRVTFKNKLGMHGGAVALPLRVSSGRYGM